MAASFFVTENHFSVYILIEKSIMKILELIKAACKKAGMDEKHAERIQKLFKIEKDEGIDDFVTLFKENVLPAFPTDDPIAKAAAEKAAKETAIAEYEETHKLKDGKPVENPPADPTPGKLPDTMDPAIKALIEKQTADIAALTGLVTGVVKKTTNTEKLDQVRAKLKGKVEDKYIERIAGKVNLDAEDLDAEVASQVADHTEFVQSLMVDIVGDNYVQPVGKPAGEKTVKEWGEIMDRGNGAAVGVVDLGLGK